MTREEILEYHLGGKVALKIAKQLNDVRSLSMAYTPGVAVPVKEIARDSSLAYDYTAKANSVAVVTDGTAILGLGDLGAAASVPVMEGKAVLFKAFGDINAWPVPLDHCRKDGANKGHTDPQRVIDAVSAISPMYGGINLEDIAAPACFEIEDKLEELLDIPVFHDDQWGTAVITLAGVLNYCKLSQRDLTEIKIVINGAGAAGIRIADTLKAVGAKSIIMCDSKGVIRDDRTDLNNNKKRHAVKTSAANLSDAMKGTSVFIGVSVADCVKPSDILSMADYPAVFAMANPDPEIKPELVEETMGENPYVMATGRSDYSNQVNNVLGFPFLFRGALDVRATTINMEMKIAAAKKLAEIAQLPATPYLRDLFEERDLVFGNHYVIPKPFDRRLFTEVPFAVAEAAIASGAAKEMDLVQYRVQLECRDKTRY